VLGAQASPPARVARNPDRVRNFSLTNVVEETHLVTFDRGQAGTPAVPAPRSLIILCDDPLGRDCPRKVQPFAVVPIVAGLSGCAGECP